MDLKEGLCESLCGPLCESRQQCGIWASSSNPKSNVMVRHAPGLNCFYEQCFLNERVVSLLRVSWASTLVEIWLSREIGEWSCF
jgi:hypothetical protein